MNKFGQFTDSQLADWMRCNPGGAARAFEFWRKSHPDAQKVPAVHKERVVYKDRVVYQDRVVTEVEKVTVRQKNPLNVGFLVCAGVSLIVAAASLVSAFTPVEPQIVVREVPTTNSEDYLKIKDLEKQIGVLRGSLLEAERNSISIQRVESLKTELKFAYGIICRRTRQYCNRN
jgi:hypothetical protein